MPKKLLSVLGLSLIGFIARGQYGRLLIEAGGSYNKRNVNNDTGTFYQPVSLSAHSISVRLGYNINKHWTVGFIYQHDAQDYLDALYVHAGGYTTYYTTRMKSLNTTFGAYGRYSWYLNEWLYLYGQLEAVQYKRTNETGETTSSLPIATSVYPTGVPLNNHGLSARAFPAIGINVIKGFGLDLNIGGIAQDLYRADEFNDNSFSVTLGRQFNMGLHKFIGNGSKKKRSPNN